jgi:hypothetical protein
MPPGQPGPEAGMPPEGMPQEGAPQEPSKPVPDLSEEEMQALYEEAWFIMEDLIDDKPTFDAARRALQEAEEMMPEQYGMMMMGVIGKLEQEVGPMPQEVIEPLIEHIIEETPDRYGISLDDNERDRAGSAFFGMYYGAHPDRIPWTQEEVEEMLAGEGDEEEAPEEGMPEEGMPEDEMQPEMGPEYQEEEQY